MSGTFQAIWGSISITREELLQKITLVAICAPTPEAPRAYELVEHQQRAFTIHQEAEVAANLSFLSRRSKESHNVAAIALEEEAGGRGITVRVAVNGKMLTNVVEALASICKVLEAIARQDISMIRTTV